MILSKALILGGAAAALAAGTGFYVSLPKGDSGCEGGCPIQRALFGSDTPRSPSPCCQPKAEPAAPASVETPTLAACVGGPAYVTHAAPITCCTE